MTIQRTCKVGGTATQLLASLAVLVCLSPPAHALSAFDLNAPPNGGWATTTPTLEWKPSTDVTSYEVWLDGSLAGAVAYTNCWYNGSICSFQVPASPVLAVGFHTWKVIAKDGTGGSQNSTSTWSFKVDATPPDAFDLAGPSDLAWFAVPNLTWSWTPSSDAESGLAAYELWVDGAKVASVSPPDLALTWAFTAQAAFNDPFLCNTNVYPKITPCPSWGEIDGGWCDCSGTQALISFYKAGGGAAASRTVNGPFSSLLAGSQMAVTAKSGYYAGDKSTIELQCWAGAGGATKTLPVTLLPPGNADMSGKLTAPYDACAGYDDGSVVISWYSPGGGLYLGVYDVAITGVPEGTHTWYVVARDVAGNSTQSTSARSVKLDAPPLGFNLDKPAQGAYVGGATPTFSWQATTDKGSGLDHFELILDENPVVTPVAISELSVSLPQAAKLGEGKHTWTVKAYDHTGAVRRAAELRTVIADFTGPDPVELSAPADGAVVALPTPDFSWGGVYDSGSGFDHFEITIGGKVYQVGSSTQVSAPDPLAEGTYEWSVTAYDKVGNATPSDTTRIVSVDFYPPGPFDLLLPADAASVYESTPTLSWSASTDTGSGVQSYDVYIDGAKNGSVAGNVAQYSPPISLAAGAHKWYVKAIDKGGAATASKHTFTMTLFDCLPSDTKPCAGLSQGICTPGHYTCTMDATWGTVCDGVVLPKKEVCNGLDDDCNGSTDESLGQTSCGVGICAAYVQNCVDGVPKLCVPLTVATSELCDGLDNNCDGVTDEGFAPAPGTACSVGVGECQQTGVHGCSADGFQTVCSAQALPAGTETCNGKDDDCDGQTDNGLGEASCGSGICAHTTNNCVGGVKQICNPFAGKATELCNGMDDDCDGATDENGVCGAEVDPDASSGEDATASDDAIADGTQTDTVGANDADAAAPDVAGADGSSQDSTTTDVAEGTDASSLDAAPAETDASSLDATPAGTDASTAQDAQVGTDLTAGVDADASGTIPGPDVDAGVTELPASSGNPSKGCTAGSAGDSGAPALAGLVALALLIRRRMHSNTTSA